VVGREHTSDLSTVTLHVPDRDRRAASNDCPIKNISSHKAVRPDNAPGPDTDAGNNDGLTPKVSPITNTDREPSDGSLSHRHASQCGVVGENMHPSGDVAEVSNRQIRSRSVKDYEGADPGPFTNGDAAERMDRVIGTGPVTEPELPSPLPTIEQDVSKRQTPVPPATQFRIGLGSEDP
ncbi:uncharacterized protein METZ01_LOCUS118465, partial [marine metagenome]